MKKNLILNVKDCSADIAYGFTYLQALFYVNVYGN